MTLTPHRRPSLISLVLLLLNTAAGTRHLEIITHKVFRTGTVDLLLKHRLRLHRLELGLHDAGIRAGAEAVAATAWLGWVVRKVEEFVAVFAPGVSKSAPRRIGKGAGLLLQKGRW